MFYKIKRKGGALQTKRRDEAYVSRFITAVAVMAAFFCAAPGLQAQLYRVHRPIPRLQISDGPMKLAPPLEISISAVASAGRVKDAEGGLLVGGMYGGRLRVLWRLSELFSVGAEAQLLEAPAADAFFFSHLRKESYSAVLKYTFTPQTEPRLYLLLSAGKVYNRASFEFRHENLDEDGYVWGAGAGGEIRLARGWRLSGEYRAVYEPGAWNNFALKAPRLLHEFAAGISCLF